MQSTCHVGCTDDIREIWLNGPNLLTAVRTLGCVVLVGLAAGAGESATGEKLLLAALLVYWVGDIADGLLARTTGTETRTGAVLDVLADRLSVVMVIMIYVSWHPVTAIPAAVFLIQFVVLDAYLTMSFRTWSLLSPNYFFLVEPTVYKLNWSPVAKGTNTGAVVLTVLVTGSIAGATLLATAVFVVKAWSTARVARLPHPRVLSGCAVVDAGRVGARAEMTG